MHRIVRIKYIINSFEVIVLCILPFYISIIFSIHRVSVNYKYYIGYKFIIGIYEIFFNTIEVIAVSYIFNNF